MKLSTNLLTLLCALAITQIATGEDWLRFRGPNGSGVSKSEQETVTNFGDDENLIWKTRLPGPGASSPVVVGNRVFVTCYSGYGESKENVGDMQDLQRHLVCIDRTSGKVLWEKSVPPYLPEDEFRGMGVPEHGYSSSTPVSDGKHLFVFFGKSGVIAYDLDGKEIWRKSVGTNSGIRKWGSASSPILFDGILIVNASDEDQAIYGIEAMTGKELWKTKTEDMANVWNTPVIISPENNPQLVISVPDEVWALNPRNGKLKWYVTKGVDAPSVSTSIVVDGENIIAMGGRSRNAVAVKTGGKSDVTDKNIIWEGRAISTIATPISYQGHLYSVTQGIANCISAATGKEVYKERIPSSLNSPEMRPTDSQPGDGVIRLAPPGGNRRRARNYSSPVIADGKIYQFTRDGTCYVLTAKPEYELLATNQFLADTSGFNSTPAISNGRIFIRSNQHLYCIGAKTQ